MPQIFNHVIYDIEAWSRFLGQEMRLPRFKQPRLQDPWIPSDEEVLRIRKAARNNPDRTQALRNGILMNILFFGGLRIGEIVTLSVSDIEEKGIRVRSEKNEAPRFVGLPDELIKDIREYIENYRYRTDPNALFTTKKGRMNYQFARNIVKKVALLAGVPKFHAHAARHWNATTLLKQPDMDIRKVQIHLGHGSISSTQRYTHLTNQEVADVVRDKMEKFFRKAEIKKGGANLNETDSELSGTAEI